MMVLLPVNVFLVWCSGSDNKILQQTVFGLSHASIRDVTWLLVFSKSLFWWPSVWLFSQFWMMATAWQIHSSTFSHLEFQCFGKCAVFFIMFLYSWHDRYFFENICLGCDLNVLWISWGSNLVWMFIDTWGYSELLWNMSAQVDKQVNMWPEVGYFSRASLGVAMQGDK